MTNINVTTQHQSILLRLIFDYLSGSELSGIHQELSKLCNQTHRHAKTLYQNTRLSLDNKTSLFSILNVPAIKQADYLKETEPLKLLSRLHQDGYGYDHLDYFLKRIDNTKPNAYWKKLIIIGTSLTAFLTYLYYSGQTIFSIMYDSICIIFTHKVVDWVKNTCLLLKNIPILGIIYQSGALLWQLYSTFRYGFENMRQKMTTSLFGVLSKGSAITGYSISLFAAGIATPAAGILFTLSGLIEVLETLIHFISVHTKPPAQGSNQVANALRQHNQRQFVSSTLWIKLAAAIALSSVVAIWCFCPASLILVLSCISLMSLISASKYVVINHLQKRSIERLQHQLQALSTGSPIPTLLPETPIIQLQSTPNQTPSRQIRFFPEATNESPREDSEPTDSNTLTQLRM